MIHRHRARRAAPSGDNIIVEDSFTDISNTSIAVHIAEKGGPLLDWAYVDDYMPINLGPTMTCQTWSGYSQNILTKNSSSHRGPLWDTTNPEYVMEFNYRNIYNDSNTTNICLRMQKARTYHGYFLKIQRNATWFYGMPGWVDLGSTGAITDNDLFRIEDNGVDNIKVYINDSLTYNISATNDVGNTLVGMTNVQVGERGIDNLKIWLP